MTLECGLLFFAGIIGTGDGYAVASKAGMGLEGTMQSIWYPAICWTGNFLSL
jgi:hypothetical protein